MGSGLQARRAIVVALVIGSAGCSSSAGPSATPTGTAAASPSPSSAGSSPVSARPADACTMLTSDQVASAIGTPGPYHLAHEDPGSDGLPVWGCTWGSYDSYADIREMTEAQFAGLTSDSDFTTKPVSGIGDKAVLETMNPDGRNPALWFTAGGGYYVVTVVMSRSETGAANASREITIEQALSGVLAKGLKGR